MAATTKRATGVRKGAISPHNDAEASLADAFVRDVLGDWREHGVSAIAAVRSERPHEYLKLVTGLLAKDLQAKGNELDALTDDQLAAELDGLLAQLARAGGHTGARD
jgi:hypothetical protein